MKRGASRIARVLALAGLSLVVILAAGTLFVQTAYFKGWLSAQIVRAIEGEIEGRLRISSIDGPLFTGVTLSGVAIEDGGSPVISVDKLQIRYFLPALLLKTLDVTRITISRPRLTFRQERDGTWNYQHAFAARKKARGIPSRSPLEGWSLRAGRVDLSGASAWMTDRRGKTVAGIPAISMSSRAVLTLVNKRLEGTVDLDTLCIDVQVPVSLPVVISGKGGFGPPGIQVRYLDITAGSSRGRVSGTLATGTSPFIDARADFPVVSFDDVRRFAPSVLFSSAAALAVEFRGTPSSFTAASTISYGGLRIESSGTADLSRFRIGGISRIRNCHPEEVVPGCTGANKASCLSGDVSLDLVLDVDGNPFEAGSGTCTVNVLPSCVGPVSTKGGTLDLAVKNGGADLRAEDFATSAGSFSVRGLGEVSGLVKRGAAIQGNIMVHGNHVDLAQVTGSEAVKSDLNFSLAAGLLKAAGKPKGILLSGYFRESSSTVQGIVVSEVTADFTVGEGAVSVSSLSVISDILHLTARGTVSPRGGLDASYSLAVSDLGAIERFVPAVHGAGSVTSTGTVRGTMARPAFSGSVTGENLRYQGFAAQTISIEANVLGGGMKNRLPSGEIRLIAGDLSAGKTTVKGVDVNAVSDGGRVTFNGGLQKDDERSVYLAGEADLREHGRAQILLTDLEVRAGTVTWSNARPVQAILSPGRVAIGSFDLTYAGQSLSVFGEWENRGDIRLNAAVRDVDLGTAAGTAGISLPLAGIMQSSFTVRGKTASPEINGTLFVSSGTLGVFPFDRIASTVTYGEGKTRLLLSVAGNGRDVLVASGTIPAGTTENMNLYLTARDLDLSVLSALTPVVETASGRVTAAIIAGGSMREPKINGELALPGGTLTIRGAGVTYRDLHIRLRFAGDTLYIDRLSLKSDQGDAGASGSVRFKGVLPESGSVDITASRFKAMGARIFSGLVSADLRLRPQGDGTLLSGKVTVDEGEVNIPKASPRPGAEITVIETGAGGKPRVVKAPARISVPLVSGLAMHVDAEVPGNTWVRGNGLNAEAQGKLLLARNAGEPLALSGDISTVRGTYQFRGKLLTIDQGKLAFTGEPRINPELNAQASIIVDNITIYVTLRGTVAQPRITLRSDPPRDESDLIAYLVFGRPLSKLSQTENQMVQRAAVQALGGLAVTGLRDFLGQNLAPDVLNVYSGQESGVSVGKYITNRLFVRYEWRFGLEEVRQTIIRVQLNRHFVLNSQVGSEETSGVDLIWTTNY